MAGHRRRAAARLDEDVGEEQVGVDADRGHVDNMDRMFFSAEDLRRVVNHRRRGDQHLGREVAVAARQPARPKDVARRRTAVPSTRRTARAPRRSRPTRPPPESRGRQPRPDATLNPAAGGLIAADDARARTCYAKSDAVSVPGRAEGRQVVPQRQTNPLLPSEGQRGRAHPDRRGLPGVQRRAARRGVPHFRRQDAGEAARHDDRADRSPAR